MIIEYPNRIFDFQAFICNEYEGETQEFEENTSDMNIKVDEQENILSVNYKLEKNKLKKFYKIRFI